LDKKEFQIKLGLHLAKLRKAKKLTQVDLAHLLDKEKQNINRIEKGNTNVTVHYLYELSIALEIPLSETLNF
jgi:transcriptional regulator with XRE-family HTH domain